MLKLYDLAAANVNIRFRPYCFRVKMALAHKKLAVKFLPGHFTEKKEIEFSGKNKFTIHIDGENIIADSWEIAKYLENEYPNSTSLKLMNGEVIFIKFWTESILHSELLKFIALDIHNSLSPKDKIYFRISREKINFAGQTLEEVVLNREKRLPHFQKLLSSLRKTLNQQNFVAG